MTRQFDRRRIAAAGALVVLAGIAALVGIAAATSTGNSGAKAAKPIKLEDSTMIVELNDTDNDAGVQPFLDGEPWTRMAIQAPNGRRILDVDAEGKLNKFGLTELFAESHEPEFSELPLAKFKKRFPAGKYRFQARRSRAASWSARRSSRTTSPTGPSSPRRQRGQRCRRATRSPAGARAHSRPESRSSATR